MSEFEDVAPSAVIERLAAKFADECHEWDGLDDGSFSADLFTNDLYYRNFDQVLSDVDVLLTLNVTIALQDTLYRLLYAQVVTAMETYLADAFTTVTLSDPKFVRAFVQSNPDYKKRMAPLADVLAHTDGILGHVTTSLQEVMWHNLSKALNMFLATLAVKPGARPDHMLRAIPKRHDIVHRNGKTKDGDDIMITKDDVANLAAAMREFIDDINNQLPITGA